MPLLVTTAKTEDGWWVINEDKRTIYLVSNMGTTWSCTCPSFTYTPGQPDCKHINAAKEEVKRRKVEKKGIKAESITLQQNAIAPRSDLSSDQQKLYAAAIRWWQRRKSLDFRNTFLIAGYAGTGKTYTCQQIALELIRNHQCKNIAIVAPTHKATRVIERMAKDAGLNHAHIGTLHSLLHLKPDGYSPNGDLQFRSIRSDSPYYDDFQLVIVDESSMISQELLDQIPAGVPTILMGDPAQLPPVMKDEHTATTSPVFDLGCEIELTQVIRYEGAIAEYTAQLRRQITASKLPRLCSGGNITTYRSLGRWENASIDMFVQAWRNGANASHVKALAWTNRRVRDINEMVRQAIFPFSEEPYLSGESLIAKEPIFIYPDDYFRYKTEHNYMAHNTEQFKRQLERIYRSKIHDDVNTEKAAPDPIMVMNTFSECIVESVQPGVAQLMDQEIMVYCLKIAPELGDSFVLPVVHEESFQEVKKRLAEFKKTILSMEKDQRSSKWKLYYQSLAKFNLADRGGTLIHRLQYSYALTVHSSQGSTFNHVFIDTVDILKCRTVEVRNKLLYVACSRASDHLHPRVRY